MDVKTGLMFIATASLINAFIVFIMTYAMRKYYLPKVLYSMTMVIPLFMIALVTSMFGMHTLKAATILKYWPFFAGPIIMALTARPIVWLVTRNNRIA